MMKLLSLVGQKTAQASYQYYKRFFCVFVLFLIVLSGLLQPRAWASADPNDPNQTNNKKATGRFIGTPIPTELILRLVDCDGEPVEGARIGTSIVVHDTDMLNFEENRTGWLLGESVISDNVSDENGNVAIPKEQLYKICPPDEPVGTIYILHESRRIGAFVEVSRDDFPGPKQMTLVPLCRLQGKVGSEGLDALGRPLATVRIFLGPERNLQYISGPLNRFEFLVPPGEFELFIQCTNTKDVSRMIEIGPEISKLDLGTIDLTPNVLEDFIGKPAPEIGPIKEWEDGQAVKLADFKGKVVLLYFGGSYPDTMFALPKLVELHNAYADKGLVIIALYTVESLKPIREKLDLKFGGVSGPAFKLAIDGGDGNKINNRTAHGNTHVTYQVNRWATNVLINQDGCVERLVDLRQAADVVGQMLDAELPEWLKNCKDTYRLEDGQVFKHISPPFLPMRREFFESLNPRLAKIQHTGPSGMLFQQQQEPVLWSLVTQRSMNLSDVIEYVLDLSDPNYQPLGNPNSIDDMTELHNPDPEGFERLLDLPVSGDWILRHEAPLKEKVEALKKLIAEEFGYKVRIEKQTVEREAIIARGMFKFSPVYSNTELCVYSGPGEINKPTGETFLGSTDSLAEFFQRLGFLIGMPVIDQTDDIANFNIQFRAHLGRPSLRHDKTLTKLKRQRLAFLLDNLSKQTNLSFEISSRPLDIWRVQEIKDY